MYRAKILHREGGRYEVQEHGSVHVCNFNILREYEWSVETNISADIRLGYHLGTAGNTRGNDPGCCQ